FDFVLIMFPGMYSEGLVISMKNTVSVTCHSDTNRCSGLAISTRTSLFPDTRVYRALQDCHSVMNYSFAVVLCVSESVKDIFRLHACLQDSSLFPHFLITSWPSTTADYGYPS
ncbi:hypothetical protein J6590_052612, partial [Homalodisca vitripennis]